MGRLIVVEGGTAIEIPCSYDVVQWSLCLDEGGGGGGGFWEL